MGRLAVLALGAGLGLAAGAVAQDLDPDSPLGRAMGKNPDRFILEVTDLIAGFGGPEGLTAAGIEDYIALERARARASALRRMLAVDLDADGALTREELAVSQRAASSSARGQLERQFLAADANADGRVDPGEMTAEGIAAALRSLGGDEADGLRALITLDRDGNGAVTSGEVAAALVLADEAT